MTHAATAQPEPITAAPQWVTREIVEDTKRTWQRYYETPLTDADAIDIINSFEGLFQVFEQ